MSGRDEYHALQVHRKMLGRMVEGQSGSNMKMLMGAKASDILTASACFFGRTDKWSDAQPIRDFIKDTRSIIKSVRLTMRPDKYHPVATSMRQAEAKANVAVRAHMNPKSPTKAYPSIRCQHNRKPAVIEDDNGGVAVLSVNWMRSVHRNGIAICDIGNGDKALLVRAKHYPSVFLAEMGVTCFEAEGMRLGVKARRVEGYAFHVKLAEKDHAVLNPNFNRGVAMIKTIIDEAFHTELGKVQ